MRQNHNKLLEETFNYVVKKYNFSIDKSENVISVFSEIGKTLNDWILSNSKANILCFLLCFDNTKRIK